MTTLRILENGKWNKPPVLTAARKVLISGLRGKFSSTTLGEMAEFVNGTSYNQAQLMPKGTPIIRISNISDPESGCLFTNETFADRFLANPGDLLVSWSASFKSIIWPGRRGVVNQHIFKVTEKPDVDRLYLRHAIEDAFDEMQQRVVGIGMMHIRRGDFLQQPVPAPPLEVQKAVAQFLDWIERPTAASEPELPMILAEQRRMVAKVKELSTLR